MPGTFEDGWYDGFSNVVCVRTKPVSEQRNNETITCHVKPIARTRRIRSVQMNTEDPGMTFNGIPDDDVVGLHSTSILPARPYQTVTHTIYSSKLPETSNFSYLAQLPPRPKRQSYAVPLPRVRKISYSPADARFDAHLAYLPLPSIRSRSSSLPPLNLAPAARRYSVSSTDHFRNIDGTSRTSSSEFRNNKIGCDLSELITKTNHAKDTLDQHKSLLDRYLLPDDVTSKHSYSRFSEPTTNSLPPYQRFRSSSVSGSRRPTDSEPWYSGSRRPSISGAWSAANSRASSVDRSDVFTNTSSTQPKVMSEARRKIRQVLFNVSGDRDYLRQ